MYKVGRTAGTFLVASLVGLACAPVYHPPRDDTFPSSSDAALVCVHIQVVPEDPSLPTAPVPGALVTIEYETRLWPSLNFQTDHKGAVRLPVFPDETFSVQVWGTGYSTVVKGSLTVAQDEILELPILVQTALSQP